MSREMKDSGIPWIGNIPKKWKVLRIKNVVNSIKSGGTPDSSNSHFYNENGTPWVSIGDMVHGGWIYGTKKHLSQEGIKDKSLITFPIGTLLYSIYASIGKVSILNVPATINQAILAISFSEDYSCILAKYALMAMEDYVLSNANGNTQFNLNSSIVSNLYIPFANFTEQQRIASFLDKKCAEVDEMITLQEKIIEELKAYKQSVITEAVTKGLNPNVPMKESGIAWIGQIPAHWEVLQLKRYCSVHSGKEIECEVDITDTKAIPVYGSGGVFKYTSRMQFSGESVMFGRKGTLGKPIYVNSSFWAVDTMYYLTFGNKLNGRYNYYQLVAFDWNPYITQTALPSIVATDIINTHCAFPPISEQQSIANYLDTKCTEIDNLISIKQQKIEHLKEYKKSIIYEYVTGKKEVED